MPIPPPRRPLPERRPDDDGEEDLKESNRPRLPISDKGPPIPPQRGRFTTFFQVAGMVLLMLSAVVWMLWEPQTLVDPKREADTIRSYARMNPLPSSATEIRVLQPDESPDGSLGVMFKANDLAVHSWLSISSGTTGVKPEFQGDVFVYKILPNPRDPDGRHAEVRWRKNEQLVWLAVSAASSSVLKKAR